MSRAYDGNKRPVAEYDPQKQLQFALDKAIKDLGEGLFDMVNLVYEALKELVKEVVDKIVGFVTDPGAMLEDLAEWVLNVPKLIGGLLSSVVIPGLDASKIISGFFSIGQISGLQANLDSLDAAISAIPGAQELIDKICNALGVPGTGHSASDVFTALSNIPGGNIVGAIAASLISGILNPLNIPGLDASKIISGTISQTFLSITSIAASIITGVLSSLTIPGLDASKITGGTIDKLRFPDVTADMSSDMRSVIDGLINAAKNTPGASGQSASALESTWAALQTAIYNVFGGNNASRASQQEAADALTTLKDTVAQQGNAISQIQGMLEGANGFSTLVSFRPTETLPITTPGAFSYTAPPWFNTVTDFLDVILVGAGSGGGGGLSDDSSPGTDSVFKANGVIKATGIGGALVGPGPGGGIGASPGDQLYLDILYPGGMGGSNTQPGTQPGGGGGGGNFFGVIGKGGNCGLWDATTLGPGATTAPFTGTVGTGGAGTSGGFGAREGGHGKVWVRARAGMPAAFTSMGIMPAGTSLPALPGISLFRLNTGTALTDEMTAVGSWSRIPPGGASGGHVIIVRANTTFSHFVYLRVWHVGGTTNYEIGRVVSNSRAVWRSGTIASAIPLNAFSLIPDSGRVFTVAINGVSFDSYSDTLAASSSMGPAYLSGGWGSSDAGLPGSIQQFGFMDSGTPAVLTGSTIAAGVATSSATYADLTGSVGPAVTLLVPQSGRVIVDISADMATSAITTQTGFMGIALSGANTEAASDAKCARGSWAGTSGLGGTISNRILYTGLNPGTTTFTSKFKSSSGSITFSNRRLNVDPRP